MPLSNTCTHLDKGLLVHWQHHGRAQGVEAVLQKAQAADVVCVQKMGFEANSVALALKNKQETVPLSSCEYFDM